MINNNRQFQNFGEYLFSNSVLTGLRPNFASQNSTKLNIHRLRPNFEIGSKRGNPKCK
jgi:hypothetical protein